MRGTGFGLQIPGFKNNYKLSNPASRTQQLEVHTLHPLIAHLHNLISILRR